MVAKSETLIGSIEDIRAFCAVIDFHTITEAAAHLGETKGSVSRRVVRLEAALGVHFLARTSRSVSPSNEGLEFYEKATAAIAMLDEATEDVRKSRTILRGSIRVTAPLNIAIEILPEVVTQFRKEHPQITIEILATDAVLDLMAHRADLAIRVGVGALPNMSLQAQIIARPSAGLFASFRYLEGRQSPSTPADLLEHDIVMPRERPGLTSLILSDGNREERLTLRPAVRASDLACVVRLVTAGAGIAVLPEFLAAKYIKDGQLNRVLPEWNWSGHSGVAIYAITAPGRLLSARVRAFRDFVAQHLL